MEKLQEIKITLPDGSQKAISSGSTGLDLAKSISPGLAKKAVGLDLKRSGSSDYELQDLTTELGDGDEVKIICAGDKKSYEFLRHTTSHALAAVVQKLFPHAKVGVGPATENGFFYDFQTGDQPITDDDLKAIEKELAKFASGAFNIVREEISDVDKRLAEFKKDGEIYKAELTEEHRNDNPTEYYFVDNNGKKVWSDFCAGPHIPNTKFIKHVKIMNVAGTNWRGDVTKDPMQRVYGTVWWSQEELDQFLKQKEEAEKRDHRKLAKKQDLFSIHQEDTGAGLVLWHGNLATVRNELEDYWKELHRKSGYEFVVTPHIAKSELWDTSGHNSFYRENMYTLNVDEQEYVLKPMNCPFHVLIYKDNKHSYRDLPIRYAELGTVYRNEASGAVHGLARVRGFTQDDAHIFCRRDQYVAEIKKVCQLTDEIYKTLGLTYDIELSTKPEDAIGTDEIWSFAEEGLRQALDELNLEYEINPGDGAFYGPKIDFKLKDAIGRIWQGATVQLDFNLPERFDLSYTNADNQDERPVMIHRAIYGSLERACMVLIEHYAGAFPTWLAPTQVMVVPIADRNNDYAEQLKDKLIANSIRSKADYRSERMNYKIREAQEKQIPYMLVVGDKEQENGQINVRYRRGDKQELMSLDEFIAKVNGEIETRAIESFLG